MRTTLTLEDDVAVRVRRILASRETSLKALVNEALRRGLDVLERPDEERAPYRLKPRRLGRCLVPDLDSVTDALTVGEGEGFR
jgi:hypothetical protein